MVQRIFCSSAQYCSFAQGMYRKAEKTNYCNFHKERAGKQKNDQDSLELKFGIKNVLARRIKQVPQHRNCKEKNGY
jgi:hypothetical protein